MFPARYFNDGYFTSDYWVHEGGTPSLPPRLQSVDELRPRYPTGDSLRSRPQSNDSLRPQIDTQQ